MKEEREMPGGETHKRAIRELIARRKEARVRGDKKDARETSKRIQKEMKQMLRRKKREKVALILSEFKGLRHIADARNIYVRRRVACVRDGSGKLRTDRKGIVDAFAEIYEELYARCRKANTERYDLEESKRQCHQSTHRRSGSSL